MAKFRSVAFLLVLSSSLLASGAAGTELTQHAQLWTPFSFQSAVTEQTRAILELQSRLFDDGQSRWIVRPSLQLLTGGGWSFSLGWFEQAIVSPGKEAAWEHRPWQQGAHEQTLAGWKWANRSRLEERFLPAADQISWRWRQQSRAVIPLADGSPWSLILSDEIFIHLNSVESKGIRTGLDQNRAFVGLGTELAPGLRCEFGYLNNYVHSSSSSVPHVLNHVGQVSLTLTL